MRNRRDAVTRQLLGGNNSMPSKAYLKSNEYICNDTGITLKIKGSLNNRELKNYDPLYFM